MNDACQKNSFLAVSLIAAAVIVGQSAAARGAVIYADGDFATVNQGDFTAGVSALSTSASPVYYTQKYISFSAQATSDGNPGNNLQFGLWGSAVDFALAAPASDSPWTLTFDYIAATGYSSGNTGLRVYQLASGDTMSSAYSLGGASSGVSIASLVLPTNTNDAYVAETLSFTAPADAVAIGFAWFGDYGPGARLDNIQVTGPAVPEPASLGFLALGGLALLRRRR
jgi:hypothetical protein